MPLVDPAVFRRPPPGFGEVPFWWWNGDHLDPARLRWQLDRLAGHGVSGMQVNYAHAPHAGGGYGLTYPSDPPLFSEAWWRVWDDTVSACRERGLRLGLSDYTLAWPGSGQWVDRIAADPAFRGAILRHRSLTGADGAVLAADLPEDPLCVRAYPLHADGSADGGAGRDLGRGRSISWTCPAGSWLVVAMWAEPVEKSLDPMHPQLGQRVVAEHFQRFADRLPAADAKALDYFFQDELMFGLGGGQPWSPFLAPAFRARTGYDLLGELPALVADLGPRSAKVRLDLADTAAQLMEDGYFTPIHAWHAERGMIYGCDQMGRGLEPQRYGGYMRAIRWFSAPGHDTPGVGADLVKGKVSSSIAHLNRRPRVWLEGYHSAGWGMEPGRILGATVQNYVYGCSLLSLHGLYYSTHGSHWEWAPPCYHFRMPYWDDFAEGLRGVERLSWLLTQGVHRCDVAVLYPIAALDSGLATSPEPAFAVMRHLVEQGLDADFIDDTALAAAHIVDGVLEAADERFRVLILADAPAMRHASLERAAAFARSGGLVITLGRPPVASERQGLGDPAVAALVASFGGHAVADPAAAVALINARIARDCVPDAPMLVLHRACDGLDLWLLVGARPGAAVELRAVGPVELWDPWTGAVTPLATAVAGTATTRVQLPQLPAPHDAWIVVIRHVPAGAGIAAHDADAITSLSADGSAARALRFHGGACQATSVLAGRSRRLAGLAPEPPAALALDGAWDFSLQPTMDNTWGDFRLPISETLLGAEARQLEISDGDSGIWRTATCGFGAQAWRLDLPATVDADAALAAVLAAGRIDPTRPLALAGQRLAWSAQEFSWRWGAEGDPGEQGYHGLKGVLCDEVLVLGERGPRPENYDWRAVSRLPGETPTRLLWTTLHAPGGTKARVLVGGLPASGMWLDGTPIAAGDLVTVGDGASLVLRYDGVGRSHVVLRREFAPVAHRTLATRWWCDPAILPWAAQPDGGVLQARCLAPPGLRSLTLTVHGQVEAWIDGKAVALHETGRREDGSRTLVGTVAAIHPAQLTLRLRTPPGYSGLLALPEPIRFTTGEGRLEAGDWSQVGVLRDYSGSAWYRRDLDIDAGRLACRTWLDLGAVGATAAVQLNGEHVGTLLSAPWRLELTGRLRAGRNRLEIRVSNTLANHYRTIPTRYQGELTSGLLGPVHLIHAVEVELREALSPGAT